MGRLNVFRSATSSLRLSLCHCRCLRRVDLFYFLDKSAFINAIMPKSGEVELEAFPQSHLTSHPG